MGRGRKERLPRWIPAWLIFTSVVQVFDVVYFLLMPDSIPPLGEYSAYFGHQLYYGQMDPSYLRVDHPHSAMTLIQVVQILSSAYAAASGDIVATAAVSASTVTSTTLFILEHYFRGDAAAVGLKLWAAFVFVNGIWIIVPSLILLTLGSVIQRRPGAASKTE